MCEEGHVDLLSKAGFVQNRSLAEVNWHYMDQASAHGHVNVLDWILAHIRKPGYTHRAMDLASENGHVAVLDWWTRSGLPLKFTSLAKVNADRAGHAHVVKWWDMFPLYRTLLCGSLLPEDPAPPCPVPDVLTLGSFGCLSWIFNEIGDGSLLGDNDTDPDEYALAVARAGHVHALWPFRMQVEHEAVETALVEAAKYNHLPMWRFLVGELYCWREEEPDSADLWTECTMAAAKHDSIDVFDALMIHVKTRPPAANFPDILSAACQGGSIRILKYMLSRGHWNADTNAATGQIILLQTAAASGQVDVLQWWWMQSRKQTFLLAFHKDWVEALAGAASCGGHVNVLDWLFDVVGTQPIPISSHTLVAVVIRKHKSVVEWLLAGAAKGTVFLSSASVNYLQLGLGRL